MCKNIFVFVIIATLLCIIIANSNSYDNSCDNTDYFSNDFTYAGNSIKFNANSNDNSYLRYYNEGDVLLVPNSYARLDSSKYGYSPVSYQGQSIFAPRDEKENKLSDSDEFSKFQRNKTNQFFRAVNQSNNMIVSSSTTIEDYFDA